nr:hypothetical protein [Tanacetum cinerariifolium]
MTWWRWWRCGVVGVNMDVRVVMMAVVVLGWRWREWWRRVMDSGVVDLIDRETESIFGVHQKSFPSTVAVVGGGGRRWPAGGEEMCVENLVPNLSESEDERECDVPVCDDFTTFSNLIFDADDDFSSSDNESFSDKEIPKEIYSVTFLIFTYCTTC